MIEKIKKFFLRLNLAWVHGRCFKHPEYYSKSGCRKCYIIWRERDKLKQAKAAARVQYLLEELEEPCAQYTQYKLEEPCPSEQIVWIYPAEASYLPGSNTLPPQPPSQMGQHIVIVGEK